MRLSASEWTVMNAVWELAPLSAREVHDQVKEETGWAFDTVRTILNRLVKKGILDSELRANTAYFSPRITREEARHSAVAWLTEKAFGGAQEYLMRFLVSRRELSRSEREALRDLLAEMDEE